MLGCSELGPSRDNTEPTWKLNGLTGDMGPDLQHTRHQHKWLSDTHVPHRYRLRHAAITFEIWRDLVIA